MRKDCWRNESAKSGKDTASLETPMTPAANTTTEPLTSGMLIQFEEGQVVPTDPAQWLHSVTKREPSREDFLIDSTVPLGLREKDHSCHHDASRTCQPSW